MVNVEYVSVASGNVLASEDCICISFYGPRGGSRAIECLSREEARKLERMLREADDNLTLRKRAVQPEAP